MSNVGLQFVIKKIKINKINSVVSELINIAQKLVVGYFISVIDLQVKCLMKNYFWSTLIMKSLQAKKFENNTQGCHFTWKPGKT